LPGHIVGEKQKAQQKDKTRLSGAQTKDAVDNSGHEGVLIGWLIICIILLSLYI